MGFIVPWIFGIWLYKKKPLIVILIAPIGATVAFVINEWGFNYFWQFKPVYRNVSFSSLPLDIGLYPVLACFFIYFKLNKRFNMLWLFLLFTLLVTSLEGIGLILGKVEYFNGWNIFLTFIIYLVAYLIIYSYFRILVKYQLLKG